MRYMDAGEAHGLGLIAIIGDVPAGLRVNPKNIDDDIARWDRLHGLPATQHAYEGIELLAGVCEGRTTGTPVALCLARAESEGAEGETPTRPRIGSVPRPGTSDLSAALKYDLDDCTAAAERSDARVAAIRIAAAGVAREFLADLGVEVHSYVTRIGEAAMREGPDAQERFAYTPLDVEMSPVRCPSSQATRAMEAQIEEAVQARDTLGGSLCVAVTGLAVGLGGELRGGAGLFSRLASAAFSVEGVCGMAFGSAALSGLRGSEAVDVPSKTSSGFLRTSNRSGGVEGGLSTGLPLMMRIEVAPAPSLGAPVATLDMETLESAACLPSCYDACRVPSVAVAVESEVAFALAQAYRSKFGGDCMGDVHAALDAYNARLARAAR